MAKGGENAGGAWSPNNGKGGYQWACWNCNQKGHKAAECPKRIGEVSEEGEEANSVSEVTELTRVWMVGQATEERGITGSGKVRGAWQC